MLRPLRRRRGRSLEAIYGVLLEVLDDCAYSFVSIKLFYPPTLTRGSVVNIGVNCEDFEFQTTDNGAGIRFILSTHLVSLI